MSEVHHVFSVQQGSSGTFRVTDESAWYVLHEVWEGQRLLDVRAVSRHESREDALAAAGAAEKAHKATWG